jgi:hypothetical protein
LKYLRSTLHPLGSSVKEFQDGLSTRHERYCGWNDNPCSESFCFFQVDSKSGIQGQLVSRATRMLEMLCGDDAALSATASSLLLKEFDYAGMSKNIQQPNGRPSSAAASNLALAVSLLDDKDCKIIGSQNVLASLYGHEPLLFPLQLCAATSAAPAPTSVGVDLSSLPDILVSNADKILRNIIILIAFGWTVKEIRSLANESALNESQSPHGLELSCELCGRSIALSADGCSPPLNAVQQHRFFCPWVASSEPLTRLCGWEQYSDSLLRGRDGPPEDGPSASAGSSSSGAQEGGGEGSTEELSKESASSAPTVALSLSTATATATAAGAAVGSAGRRQDPSEIFRRIQSVISTLSTPPFATSSSSSINR